MKTRSIGFLLFEQITLLDLVGPFEILARLPHTNAFVVAKTLDAVRTDLGMLVSPQRTFDQCPALDVIVVPGGPGQQALMDDETTLSFIRKQASSASYVVSICTGSLVLGAAGLLTGYRATTHWTALEVLHELGAIPVQERVVVDRNRVTSAGVSAGIDMALQLVALMESEELSRELQLQVEYYPAPAFNCEGAHHAPADLVEKVRTARSELTRSRIETASRIKRAQI